ncbi:MAG: hypothetical protein R3A44_13800 [Caldilineaceae bacterium]
MTIVQQLTVALSAANSAPEFNQVAAELAAALAQNNIQLSSAEWMALSGLFPCEMLDANPDLLFCRGLYAMQEGALETAIPLLQRGLLLYQHQGNANGAANCCLALMTVHLRREDFPTAHLHMQEAEALLARVDNKAIQTHLYLRLAELCPDIGRVAESIIFAQSALEAARRRSQMADQFKALMLLAILYRFVGQYAASAAHLARARQMQQAGELADAGYLSILNAEAHLAWYGGNLTCALAMAQQLHAQLAPVAPDKRLLYCWTLQGNLHRALGDVDNALRCYGAARKLAHTLGQSFYTPWLDAHEGWLYTGGGRLCGGPCSPAKGAGQPDRGQVMGFNVNLGLLHLLQERTAAAQPLLAASLAFYTQSGDALATAVIHFYLAWLYDLCGDPTSSAAHLHAALEWFAAQNITYFPLWHHPQLITRVCALAILRDIQPAHAERMVSQPIGAAALPLLEELVGCAMPPHSDRLQPLIAQLRQTDDSWMRLLQRITDEPARQALYDLLLANQLQRANFGRLLQRLTTASCRAKPNPVLVAVFGLYLQGESQGQMAARLHRAPATIRNYITTLYQIFELPPGQVKGAKARRARLRQAAEREGFV